MFVTVDRAVVMLRFEEGLIVVNPNGSTEDRVATLFPTGVELVMVVSSASDP